MAAGDWTEIEVDRFLEENKAMVRVPEHVVLSVDPGVKVTWFVVAKKSGELLAVGCVPTKIGKVKTCHEQLELLTRIIRENIVAHGVTHVAIERQFKAVALLRVESTLWGLVTELQRQGTIASAHIVQPLDSHKYWSIPQNSSHYQNKKNAVSKANDELSKVYGFNFELNVVFDTGKVDDIADAYLNGLYVLNEDTP